MTRKHPAFPSLCTIFFFFLLCAIQTSAQSSNSKPRITQPVDEKNLVVLHGNTYPLARPEFDQGAAPASLPMQRMLLVLQRSPEQEAALEQLLEQQQDNSSPSYHRWLTPQQFGAEFGPAAQDIQTITAWLQSHGFQVAGVSKGGIVIEFSGTAGQVQEAFHTSIHKFLVNGEQRYANASDPQIPAALALVVAGVRSLHNFPATAMNRSAGVFHRDKDSGKIIPSSPVRTPEFSLGNGINLVGPYDLATIYDVAPLWAATTPIDGTGQTIAIVGESDILPADWTAFWNMFGVATPKGTLKIIHNGPDPGIQGDESEADIDTQWSSAVAKGATIDFVVSQSTEATLGVDLSAEFIVDNNLAGVMSESYGVCELFLGTTGNAYYNALWQQASAQGITVFLASGDQGSAACDRGAPAAQYGLAVSGFESTPYNVSVGGTDFNDLATSATYWNPTNNANQANAKGYIPEMTWNDTCTNSEVFSFFGVFNAEQSCNNFNEQEQGFLAVAGGSGGASNCTSSDGVTQASCTGGYARPSWQSVPGVSSDNKRDVPDVSLFASNGFNGNAYIICQSDATGSCSLSAGSEIAAFGGTSVSAPAFAGIMALINQKTGERQGNANYVFYKMAGTPANSCNSSSVSSTGTNNCIFYDIPTGSTIAMPCVTGSPNCVTNTSGDQFGVLSNYSTTTGYDLATGLGSVNVENLVNQWSTYAGQFKGSKFSAFTLGPPATITHGQPIPVAATVVPQSGTGTPTGTVTLIANIGSSPSNQTGAQQLLTLTGGSLPANSTTTFLPGGIGFTVTAHYSGDSTFAPSDSSPFTVTVNPEASKVQPAIVTFNSSTGVETNPNATSLPYGSLYLLRANVTNSSANPCALNGIGQYGCPSGTVSLSDTFNGVTSPIGSGTYSLNSEGYAEDQAIFLFGGQHSIVASYSGDKSFNASSNSATPDVVTVTKAPTTISLISNTLTVTSGNAASVIASISTQVPLPASAPSTELPISNVQFFLGSKPFVVSSPASVVYYTPFVDPSTGYAQLNAELITTSLPLGNSTITAQFPGDSDYSQSSVSNPVTIDVLGGTSLVITASNTTIQHGSSVTFTAVVTPTQAGGPALTGTLQFSSNGYPMGSPMALVNGQAQISTSSLPGGNVLVSANYSGDSNYAATYGSLQETVVLLATTTNVSTSNAAIVQGTSVTLTAHVAPNQSGGPTLTGSVQFFSAITAQGGDNSLGIAALTNGQAQLTTAAILAGQQLVFASYSGDTNYATSTGMTAEVVAAAPTFAVAGNPTTVLINAPGRMGSTMLIFTAMNGFSGTIPLSPALCAGMPSETTCSFSASSVTLSSTITTATATVTFQTTGASTAPPQSKERPLGFRPWRLSGNLVVMWVFCMGVLFAGLRARRRRWSAVATLLAIASLLVISSCGGNGSGGGHTNPGTPVGNDPNVVITFNVAGVTPAPTVNLSVNVQ